MIISSWILLAFSNAGSTHLASAVAFASRDTCELAKAYFLKGTRGLHGDFFAVCQRGDATAPPSWNVETGKPWAAPKS